jgi:hypothetical protein
MDSFIGFDFSTLRWRVIRRLFNVFSFISCCWEIRSKNKMDDKEINDRIYRPLLVLAAGILAAREAGLEVEVTVFEVLSFGKFPEVIVIQEPDPELLHQ